MASADDAASYRESADRAVAALAARQHGVFARAQVVHCMSRGSLNRRIATGRWEAVARDVFRVGGAPPTWRQSLMIASLAWGAPSAVSHRSAGALFSLEGFDPGPVELTVPVTRRRRAPGRVYRYALEPVDMTVVDAIPVTTPARTLIDLAGIDEGRAGIALDDALRRGLVTLPRMRWQLGRLAAQGRPGIAGMRRLVDERSGREPTHSGFERLFLRALLAAGLPRPRAQYTIRHRGRAVARVDFAYPESKLAIETDGFRWHSGRARWDADLARGNEIALLGWRVLHVTWTDLRANPERVIGNIREILRSS